MLANYQLGEVFLSIMWFFLFFVWIMLLFHVFGDIFRSRDMGAFAKTLWVIFVIVAPYLGIFVYVIARGGKMAENQAQAIQAQDAAAQEYIRNAAGTASSPTAELARLADLKAQGHIDDAEFAQMKAKILSS